MDHGGEAKSGKIQPAIQNAKEAPITGAMKGICNILGSDFSYC